MTWTPLTPKRRTTCWSGSGRCREAVRDRSLEETFSHPRYGPMSLRWIMCHMCSEYDRHNGHADLLRERIDGRTGS
ncbi:DUF664 domain-containing protein [Actinopolymorpha pittospori]|uniref:mycothiol transferase n=1 Tax=Actinopolymorpha pittospori TaxID=648752 RepID=UPI00192E1B61|nr:DUF664 domain-containing protein [Actinopolymorpha pittospori]